MFRKNRVWKRKFRRREVRCPYCGHWNPRGSFNCSRCHRRLTEHVEIQFPNVFHASKLDKKRKKVIVGVVPVNELGGE